MDLLVVAPPLIGAIDLRLTQTDLGGGLTLVINVRKALSTRSNYRPPIHTVPVRNNRKSIALPRWRSEKPNLCVDRARELSEQGSRRLITKGGGSFPRLRRRQPELGEGAVNRRDMLLVAGGNIRARIKERARPCPLQRGLGDGAKRTKPQGNKVAKLLKFRSRGV